MSARSGRSLPLALTAILVLLSGLHAEAPGDLIASSPSWTGTGEPPAAALTSAAGELMQTQRVRLAALATRLADAPGLAARLEIEREIRRVKLETERELFLLQLDHAVASGNGAAEEEIRGHLAALDRFLDRAAGPPRGNDDPVAR